MSLYALILFLTGTLFLALGIAIYRGKTNLIHDYHQTNVKDHGGYGKAMGKALLVMAAGMVLSAAADLLGDSDGNALAAVAILVIALVAGLILMALAQKKYNGESL